MSYSKSLEQIKEEYPFKVWLARFDQGLEQFTPENVNAAENIINQLIIAFSSLDKDVSESEKVSYFKTAVEELNVLNQQLNGELIETEEREELCDLLDIIAISADINVSKYDDGIASEWRDW